MATASDLKRAVAAGDLDEVERLLASGVSPEGRDVDGDDTALMEVRDPAMAARLIAAGADLHAITRYGRTALLEALAYRRFDVVDVLVRAGYDLERRVDDLTALLRFCYFHEISGAAVDALVRAGADVHATTRNGQSALHLASQLYAGDRGGRLGLVARVLVAAGIPVDVRDRDRDTPLLAALGSEGGDVWVVRALLELGADVNARALGGTALMRAVTCFRARELIPVLLAAGADPAATFQGRTALAGAHEHLRTWEQISADRRDEGSTPWERADRRRLDRRTVANAREVVTLLEAVTPGPAAASGSRTASVTEARPKPDAAASPAIARDALTRHRDLRYDEREQAIAAMGALEDTAWLRSTLRALWAPAPDRDESWYRWSSGLAALLRPVAHDPGLVEMLAEDLLATDPGVAHRRDAAIELLGASQSEAAGRALVRLVHADRDQEYAVTRAFAELGRVEGWPTTMLAIAARPSAWRHGGLEALVACGGPRAIPVLLQMLDTEECARAAVPLLAGFADPAVDERLTALCGHPDGVVRIEAALVLVRHRGVAGVAALVGVARTLAAAGQPISVEIWDRAEDALAERVGDTLADWERWLEHRRRTPARWPALPSPLERLTSRCDPAREEALAALHLGRDPAHLTALMLGEALHLAWGVGQRAPTDWDTWASIVPLEVLVDREHRLAPWLAAERERLPPQIVPDILAVIPTEGVEAAIALAQRRDPGFQLTLDDDALAALRADEAGILASRD